MQRLADLLADKETVLRGYIAVAGAKVVGHRCLGRDRTLALSFRQNEDIPEEEGVLWCYLEKERGRAPLLYPVVRRAEETED